MESQTKTKVKIMFRGEVDGVFGKQEMTVDKAKFDETTEDLQNKGYEIIRWEPLSVKAVQLISKEAQINEANHEFQIVDYGGDFILRHYIGKNDPIETSLGSKTPEATEAYNQYIRDRCYSDQLLIDDLALYCGHSYSYMVG